ncbi:hypothetical protein [Bradyrhizobium sp. HKCCYLR20261]|uniref:hypothetical protein n=1 Tax=Bradyrhizobium sp. HKCCYLR20261 TaxID=3420760 RepID=UPI003EBFC4D9
MTSDSALPRVKDIAAAHPEVEFALVLARTIDAVSGDPEQLRSAVYELARHKLQQLSEDDPTEKARLMQALEVAIAGVETHVAKAGPQALPRPTGIVAPQPSRLAVSLIESSQSAVDPGVPSLRESHATAVTSSRWQVRRLFESMPARVAAVLLSIVVVVVVVALVQRGRGDMVARPSSPAGAREPAAGAVATSVPSPQIPVPAAAPSAPVAAPTRDPRLPTAYGVYADSNGRMFELQQLPGRVPDPRVAISAAITKPSESILPDGRLRFVVFQRDAAPDAFDKVEARIVARVRQATSFDASGKPVVANEDETWVIRNISIPFRASPLKDDPQMYELTPRDPDLQFSPGRYALVLKARAFDFSVAGSVTDKRQCLERLVAANGTFYSECPKP